MSEWSEWFIEQADRTFGNPNDARWKRSPGPSLGATWLHPSGWWIGHCGHATANWPYTVVSPTGITYVNPNNGRAFGSLKMAKGWVAAVVASPATTPARAAGKEATKGIVEPLSERYAYNG